MTIDDLIAELQACKRAQALGGACPVLTHYFGGSRALSAAVGQARVFRTKTSTPDGQRGVVERYYPPVVEGDKLIGGELVPVVVIAPTGAKPPSRFVEVGRP